MLGDDWLIPPENENPGPPPMEKSGPGGGAGGMQGKGMGMGPGMGMGMGGGCMMGGGMSMGCPCMGGMGGGEMMHHRYMMWIEKNDPARFEKIKKIHQLARDYRDTEDAAKKKDIETQLRPLVDDELKAEQQDAKKHLDKMQKMIDHKRKILKERDDHWKEVVDHQMKKITGEDEYLEHPMKMW